MHWDGKYYYDMTLPFGLRSAPFIFNQLSEAVEWILLNHCGISFVCHILDDFLIIEPSAPKPLFDLYCRQSLSSMLLAFKESRYSHCKSQNTGTFYNPRIYGYRIRLHKNGSPSATRYKVERLSSAFASFRDRKSCTLKELQSLIGTLNFACKVVPPGRPFLQRMIQLTRNVSSAHHHIKLNKGFFKDLAMWETFLTDWNGSNFFLPSSWTTSVSLSLHTDASGSIGFGGIFGSHWFQGTWQPHQQLGSPGISIAWQEMYALVVACHLWASAFSNKRILLFCDNQSVVNIVNSKRSHIPRVMDLVRHLTLLTLKFNFYVRVQHIEGKRNEIADSLSRFQMARFRELAPYADPAPCPVPPTLLKI